MTELLGMKKRYLQQFITFNKTPQNGSKINSMPNPFLIISGPTATGKTSLAVKLAQEFNGELISADSRQVYQGMDIVTGKDIANDQLPITNEQIENQINKRNNYPLSIIL
jgi:DNA polymerase III delta prime subunit